VAIPNAERAIIAVEKLTAYLLNPSHKRGGAKARLLLSLVSNGRSRCSGVGPSNAAPVAERRTYVAESVRRRLQDRGTDYDAERKNRTLLLDLADRYWKRSTSI